MHVCSPEHVLSFVSGSCYLDMFHSLIVASVDCGLSSVWKRDKDWKGAFARDMFVEET